MINREQDLVLKAVHLGNAIRRQRTEGNLQTLAPPTLYGYLAFVRLGLALPHLDFERLALCTLLGNAGRNDRQHVMGVINEVFGLRAENGDSIVDDELF